MAAHSQEQRGDGNALVGRRSELGNALLERRRHQLEKSQRHREIGAGERHGIADRPERLGPCGFARAVSEQYECRLHLADITAGKNRMLKWSKGMRDEGSRSDWVCSAVFP